MNDLIAFGGGKGSDSGSARVAQEAPDSLRSQAFARVLDLVCEGPIRGLVAGYQSIKLDGTPLMNEDSSLNFSGVGVDYRLGTQGQSSMAGFADTESEVVVSVEFKANLPLTRTLTTTSGLSALRIRVSVPQLTQQDTSNGDLNGSSIDIAIDLDSGAGFVQKITDTISGKTTSKYERTYTIELTGTTGPWTFRARRLTGDSTSSALQNRTFVESYTEIKDGKLRYPNSALFGIMVDASQFQSIPTRSYHLKLREVQIPTNYNPDTRAYTGSWDGTFKIDWTDNPAWCLYDMLTDTRFGMGNYLNPALIDKWSLYEIAKYCDELVPDGKGGQEPRFTCNLYLQERAEAYQVVNNMASIFRGILYWGASNLIPVQDAPADPVALFTVANVIDGTFEYQGSDLTSRHNVAIVQWNDPSDSYKQKFEYVEDSEALAASGNINSTQVVAIGCTSQGQANRAGRWLLYTERFETDLVGFKIGLDGNLVRPGQIIQVQDPLRAQVRMGGRVVSATTTSVTLDQSVEIQSGRTYTLSCMLPENVPQTPNAPANPGLGKLESKAVTNGIGTTNTLTLASPLSQIPQEMAIWVLAEDDLVPQTFRVVSVAESGPLEFAITAVAHNPSKFAHVDLGTTLQDAPIRKAPATVPPVTALEIVQHSYTDGLGVKLVLSVNWVAPAPGLTYHVEWKRNDGNWTDLGETGDTTIELPGSATPGVYVAAVTAIDSTRKMSTRVVSPSFNLVGKTEVPAGLYSLTVNSGLFENDLFWEFSSSQQPDGKATEIWASRTNDRTTAVLLISQPWPQKSAVHSSLKPGDVFYYWGRVVNTSGVESPWLPVDPLNGVRGEVSQDASYVLGLVADELAGTLAGKSLGDALNALDPVQNGFTEDIVGVQSTIASLSTKIDSIGARLDGPGGDIANAINRVEATASVAKPTPQLMTAPSSPVLGQAYFDMADGGVLKYWNGLDWVRQSSAISQTSAPADPVLGTLWLDTSNSKNIYRIWNGGAWIPASRVTIYAPVQPSIVGLLIGDTWKNTTDGSFWVYDGISWVNTASTDIGAISSRVTSLQTQTDGNTNQIQINTSSIAGLKGLFSVVMDENGHVAGIALSQELLPDGSGTRSAFTVSVDDFAVGSPDHAGQPVFVVRDGNIIMSNALIGTADIGTLKIAGNAVTIPVAVSIPQSMSLSTGQQTVASLTINFPTAPAAVIVDFQGEVANGGGANGATQSFIYRDGVLLASGQDAIVNNIGANRCIRRCIDNPGPGTHTYEVRANYAGPITSAAILGRTLIVSGAMR